MPLSPWQLSSWRCDSAGKQWRKRAKAERLSVRHVLKLVRTGKEGRSRVPGTLEGGQDMGQ